MHTANSRVQRQIWQAVRCREGSSAGPSELLIGQIGLGGSHPPVRTGKPLMPYPGRRPGPGQLTRGSQLVGGNEPTSFALGSHFLGSDVTLRDQSLDGR